MRWFLLVIFKKEFSELIALSKTFWRIREVDPGNESGAGTLINVVWKGARIYTIFVTFSCCTTMLITVIFTWKKVLPFVAWYPESFPYGYEVKDHLEA